MAVTLKPKSEITVPRSVRRKAGIKPGDRLEFEVSGRRIIIIPEKEVDPDDTLSPEEAKRVGRAQEQFRRGQFKSWDIVKNALAR